MLEEKTLVELSYDGEYVSRLGMVETKKCKIRLSKPETGLLKRMYEGRGYLIDASMTHRDENTSLTAQIDGKTVGTLTLNMDNGCLGAEKQYPEFVAQLRSQGAKICEIGKLALDPSVRSKRVLGAIFHLSWIAAFRFRHATDLIIEVNPRHAAFYKEMLQFEQVGEERICERVGAPGVLLHLNVEYARKLIAQHAGNLDQPRGRRSFLPYFFPLKEENELIAKFC